MSPCEFLQIMAEFGMTYSSVTGMFPPNRTLVPTSKKKWTGSMTTASNVKQQLLEAVHYPHEEFHSNDRRSSPTHVLYPFPPSHCRTVQTPLSFCNIHRMDRIIVFLHVVSLLASHVRVLLLYNSISTSRNVIRRICFAYLPRPTM